MIYSETQGDQCNFPTSEHMPYDTLHFCLFKVIDSSKFVQLTSRYNPKQLIQLTTFSCQLRIARKMSVCSNFRYATYRQAIVSICQFYKHVSI